MGTAVKRYLKEPLGHTATFLLPSLKLKRRESGGATVEERVHSFLLDHFAGYTAAAGNIFGYWKQPGGRESYGEHREFIVSILSGRGMEDLEQFLAEIANEIGEDCIYLRVADQSWLVYPD